MKNLKIEFHKRRSDQESDKVFMRAIQEVGIIPGPLPAYGVFFEPGFEDLFASVLDYESYLLHFMDHNYRYWEERGPGRLYSVNFNEKDLLDEEKFTNKLESATGITPLSGEEVL